MVKAILDPSGQNTILPNYACISTEIEFLRLNDSSQPLWIQGEDLCRWAKEIYRIRGWEENNDYQIIESPRIRLRKFAGEYAEKLNNKVVKRAIDILDTKGSISIGDLLAEITKSVFWHQAPSFEHAARLLLTEIESEIAPLAEAQCKIWAEESSGTRIEEVYRTPLAEHEKLFRLWITNSASQELGFFPIKLKSYRENVLTEEWKNALRVTKGKQIEILSPLDPNGTKIAQIALTYFLQNSTDLTASRAEKIQTHLSPLQSVKLEAIIPVPRPSSILDSDSAERVLDWVINEYLPYRWWQSRQTDLSYESDIVELATSFVDWLLKAYPRLTFGERSMLNICVHSEVKALLESSSVFWVVVDGLNYLDHQRLVRLLGETEAAFVVEKEKALFATLPTITEYAKASLISGALPNQIRDKGTRNIFKKAFPNGTYVASERIDELRKTLSQSNFQLCYWNLMEIDEYYHRQIDIISSQNNIRSRLNEIAGNISDLVLNAANPERVTVVLCTDHGQMLGSCIKMPINDDESAHGRLAEGNRFISEKQNLENGYWKTPDGRAVVLHHTDFRLPKPMTVALDNFYFKNKYEDTEGRAWGVHGGLYPEEVVIGFTTLRHNFIPKNISVEISGIGETGKPGKISLSIDNPNNAKINGIIFQTPMIAECQNGLLIEANIKANTRDLIPLQLTQFPAPQNGETLEIKGELFYEFADGIRHSCEVNGKLICRQIYTTQRPSLRDKFKK